MVYSAKVEISLLGQFVVLASGARLGEDDIPGRKAAALLKLLAGAITINWKEGKTETFKAGSTYFEGAGENHPSGNFSGA